MRQWRVGTLSMGLVLIVTGIILLVGQFNQFAAIKTILNWWPIILILLGTEILVYLKYIKTEQIAMKYDFLSVVFIIFLGMMTLGLYGLTTTGILDYFNEEVLARPYELPLEENRLTIPKEINKIKIMGTREKLKILTGDSNEIVSFGTIGLKATNENEARELFPGDILKTYTVGNTLFLEFQDNLAINKRTYSGYLGGITLIVPKDLPMELEGSNHNRLKVELDNLKSNWLINSQGSVDILLLNNDNLEIKTLVQRASYLEGTIEWLEHKVTEENPDNNLGKYHRSSAKWGDGDYKLQIISKGRVNVITP